jgi:hypothetical protein
MHFYVSIIIFSCCLFTLADSCVCSMLLKVQLASAELLMLICSELIYIVRDSGKGFACYIADLLSRCKVQKVVLHCVLSSVYNMKTIANSQEVHSARVRIERHYQAQTLNSIMKYYS